MPAVATVAARDDPFTWLGSAVRVASASVLDAFFALSLRDVSSSFERDEFLESSLDEDVELTKKESWAGSVTHCSP